jgi:cell fate (sporulation/competence/biofilm development) regulator YmcA (YheA/YmcA/DUF963 family)
MAKELTDEEVQEILERHKKDPLVEDWRQAGYSDRQIAEFIRDF